MPGLDKMGRPVGYGDGRDPSLADKVRLLQQLVKERQAMPKGKKKPPVASINRPDRSLLPPRGGVRRPLRRPVSGGFSAPVDPSRMPKGKPGPPLPDGKRF